MRSIRNSSVLLILVAAGAGAITGCSSTPTHESTGQYVDDGTITTKVKSKLAADAGLATAADIHVQTYKGVVQLSGFANNHDQEQRAVMLARNVDGVRGVDDSINIK
jgi:osmotically-inducible protein OsmY